MKRILLILTLTTLIFACKKEDNAPTTNTSAEVEGCMDTLAINYNPEATKDDGSCVYAETVANFSFTGANNMAPSLVTFTNSSLNATTYGWDFGDGESSIDENPTHLYAEGGNYNVSLTANGEDNQVNIISKTVSIDEVPSKLKITNLVVNTMPMTDSNGSNWDILDGPDVLYKILQGTVGLSASSSQDNLTVSDFPLAFTEGFPIELGNLIAEHSIVLEESDLFSTTEIGSLTFTPSTYMPVDETSEYPNTITLGDATLEVVLSVEWVE